MAALTRDVQITQRAVDDGWLDWVPTLGLTAQPYLQTPSTATQPERGWQAQLLLTVPLFDGGFRGAAQRDRRAQLAEAQAALAELLLEAGATLRATAGELVHREQALQDTEASAALADESLQLARTAFREGRRHPGRSDRRRTVVPRRRHRGGRVHLRPRPHQADLPAGHRAAAVPALIRGRPASYPGCSGRRRHSSSPRSCKSGRPERCRSSAWRSREWPAPRRTGRPAPRGTRKDRRPTRCTFGGTRNRRPCAGGIGRRPGNTSPRAPARRGAGSPDARGSPQPSSGGGGAVCRQPAGPSSDPAASDMSVAPRPSPRSVAPPSAAWDPGRIARVARGGIGHVLRGRIERLGGGRIRLAADGSHHQHGDTKTTERIADLRMLGRGRRPAW